MIYWLQENALVTAVLAGVVVVTRRATRCRPAIEHALWVLVLVKFVMPPLVSWPEAWREALTEAAWFSRGPCDEALEREDGSPTRADDLEATTIADLLPAENVLEFDKESTLDETSALVVGPVSPVDSGSVEMAEAGRDLDLEAGRETLNTSSTGTRDQGGTRNSEATDGAFGDGIAAAMSPVDWSALARSWLLRLWLVGSAWVLILHTARVFRFSRTLAEARRAGSELREEVESLASRLGMRAPRTLVISRGGSPLAWGLGRPALLFPAGLVECLRLEARRGILLHELAHLKRRDHYAGCLLVAAQCIWWWNPVFWFARRRLRESAELACDAWVVWAMPDDRRVYAESLIDVSRSMSTGGRALPSPLMTTFFTSRTGRVARREFERRLTMILSGSHRRNLSPVGVFAVGLFAFLTAPAWTEGQGLGVSEDESTEKSPKVEASDGILFEDVAFEDAVLEDVVVEGLGEARSGTALQPAVAAPVVPLGQATAPAVEEVPSRGVDQVARGGRDLLGGVVDADAASEDPFQPGTDRQRIERIERSIQRLERSLTAVLAELRSLRRDRSSSVDPYTETEEGLLVPVEPPKPPKPIRGRRTSSASRTTGRTTLEPSLPEISGRSTGTSRVSRSPSSRFSRTTRSSRKPVVSTVSRVAKTSTYARPTTSSDYAINVRTLTRATYKLPEGKAEALAKFLRENVTAELEIETSGDTVTVTSSSETQQTIERLIQILLPKKPRKSRAGVNAPTTGVAR